MYSLFVRKLEYDRCLIPKQNIRKATISLPKSIFQLCGVYCRILGSSIFGRGAVARDAMTKHVKPTTWMCSRNSCHGRLFRIYMCCNYDLRLLIGGVCTIPPASLDKSVRRLSRQLPLGTLALLHLLFQNIRRTNKPVPTSIDLVMSYFGAAQLLILGRAAN